MASTILLAILLIVFALVALPSLGYLKTALFCFLITCVVAPFPIFLWSSEAPNHTGITYATPAVLTYTSALVALLLGLIHKWKRNGLLLGYGCVVLIYLIVGIFAVWSGAGEQWAGLIHLVSAVVALAVGYQFGSQLNPSVYRFLIGTILFLLVINLLLCFAQLSGLPLTLFPDQLANQLQYGRPVGTFGHSSTPGKFILMMFVVLLPALRSYDSATRRMAWWSVGVAVPLVAITLARANLAAVVAAIGLWLIWDRGSRKANSKRLFLLIAAFAVSAPVLAATLDRFSSDPGGGDRAVIYHTGLKQLESNLWEGTGPNYYAEDVGRWDQMTAWGFPLHNSFLYPVAEIGLVGGLLFLLPVFVVCAIAIVDCIRGGDVSLWSKSYLVTFPGLVAIAMTGWGMLVGSTLCLWYFVIGFAVSRMVKKDCYILTNQTEAALAGTSNVRIPPARVQ